MRQTIDSQQALRLKESGWTDRMIGEFLAVEQGRPVNYQPESIRTAIYRLGVRPYFGDREFYRGKLCGKPHLPSGPLECLLCGRKGNNKRDLCFAVST